MTVKELIDKLQTLDEDKEIICFSYATGIYKEVKDIQYMADFKEYKIVY